MDHTNFFAHLAGIITIDVINIFACDEAVLLPVLYEIFCTLVNDNKAKVEVSENFHIPQARWLLTQICNRPGSNVQTAIKQKKYGGLLYKRDGDLLKALSTALGQERNSQKRKYMLAAQVMKY
jgi:predicted metallopeptidase